MFKKPLISILMTLTLAGIMLPGCKSEGEPPSESPRASSQADLPSGFFLTQEPTAAKTVEDAKKSAKPGDPITLHGRIGGAKDPFVDGRAVFTLMGAGLKPCGAGSAMPDCKTPWDYCCDTSREIAEHSATIQVVDASGAPLRLSIKGRNGIRELSDLIVVGKVMQADGRLMIVNASGVFVKKS